MYADYLAVGNCIMVFVDGYFDPTRKLKEKWESGPRRKKVAHTSFIRYNAQTELPSYNFNEIFPKLEQK